MRSLSLTQLIWADREMSKDVTSVKPTPDQAKPMAVAMERSMCDPRISMHLLPLPGQKAAQAAQALGRADRKTTVASPNLPNPEKKAKTGKAGKSPATVPAEFTDHHQTMPDGAQICWNVNMACGCSNKTYGTPARCFRGVHACAGCRKTGHPPAVQTHTHRDTKRAEGWGLGPGPAPRPICGPMPGASRKAAWPV